MPFTKKKSKKKRDTPLSNITGIREKSGQVGLEIEVEGRNLPTNPPVPWIYHRDGSLRGAENAEYILNGPVSFDDVDKVLDNLWAEFEKNKTQLDDSNRTSVHVHLNILPFYMNRLTNLMCLWFIHEDVLTHWCGEYRVGNLFCLRAKDASGIIRSLRQFIESEGQIRIGENNHYAAMNGHAIHKFGSLEFRPLRGTNDVSVVKTWISFLRRLYDRSEEWQDPRDLVETFSLEGSVPFFQNTFGGLAETIRQGVPLTDDQFLDSVFDGMRFAQELAYARDWSDFNPTKIEIDPFGRKRLQDENEGPLLQIDDIDDIDNIREEGFDIDMDEIQEGLRQDLRRLRRTNPQPRNAGRNEIWEQFVARQVGDNVEL